jgi:hypothetical protein
MSCWPTLASSSNSLLLISPAGSDVDGCLEEKNSIRVEVEKFHPIRA